MSRRNPAESKMKHMASTIPIGTWYGSYHMQFEISRKENIGSASEYTSFSDKNFLNEAEFSTLSFSKLNIFLAIVSFVASAAS
jgi:hypothetical protein